LCSKSKGYGDTCSQRGEARRRLIRTSVKQQNHFPCTQLTASPAATGGGETITRCRSYCIQQPAEKTEIHTEYLCCTYDNQSTGFQKNEMTPRCECRSPVTIASMKTLPVVVLPCRNIEGKGLPSVPPPLGLVGTRGTDFPEQHLRAGDLVRDEPVE